MNNLPTESSMELKRLERIATEKRLAYQELEKLFDAGPEKRDPDLLCDYQRAREELTKAVNAYNSLRAKLARFFAIES